MIERIAECPLLAQSRHELVHCTCPLSGVNRTSLARDYFGANRRAGDLALAFLCDVAEKGYRRLVIGFFHFSVRGCVCFHRCPKRTWGPKPSITKREACSVCRQICRRWPDLFCLSNVGSSGGPLLYAEECRRRAENADELAQITTNPAVRMDYEKAARLWRAMAERIDRNKWVFLDL